MCGICLLVCRSILHGIKVPQAPNVLWSTLQEASKAVCQREYFHTDVDNALAPHQFLGFFEAHEAPVVDADIAQFSWPGNDRQCQPLCPQGVDPASDHMVDELVETARVVLRHRVLRHSGHSSPQTGANSVVFFWHDSTMRFRSLHSSRNVVEAGDESGVIGGAPDAERPSLWLWSTPVVGFRFLWPAAAAIGLGVAPRGRSCR